MDFSSLTRSRYVQAGVAMFVGYVVKRLLFSAEDQDELGPPVMKLPSVPLQTAIDTIFADKKFPKPLTEDDLFDCEMMDELPKDDLAEKRLPFFRLLQRFIAADPSASAFDVAFVKRLVSLYEHRTEEAERAEITETLRSLSVYVPDLSTAIISALESALCLFIDDKETYYIGAADILRCHCAVLANCSPAREQMRLKCKRIIRPLLKHPLLPQFKGALSGLVRLVSQHGARTEVVQTIKTVCPSVVPFRQVILLAMLAGSIQSAPVDEARRLTRTIIPLLKSQIGIHHVTTLHALSFLQASWFCEAAGHELSAFEPLLQDCKGHFCHLVRDKAEVIDLSRYLGSKRSLHKGPACRPKPVADYPEETERSSDTLPVQVHATFVTVNVTNSVTNIFVLAPESKVH